MPTSAYRKILKIVRSVPEQTDGVNIQTWGKY